MMPSEIQLVLTLNISGIHSVVSRVQTFCARREYLQIAIWVPVCATVKGMVFNYFCLGDCIEIRQFGSRILNREKFTGKVASV